MSNIVSCHTEYIDSIDMLAVVDTPNVRVDTRNVKWLTNWRTQNHSLELIENTNSTNHLTQQQMKLQEIRVIPAFSCICKNTAIHLLSMLTYTLRVNSKLLLKPMKCSVISVRINEKCSFLFCQQNTFTLQESIIFQLPVNLSLYGDKNFASLHKVNIYCISIH